MRSYESGLVVSALVAGFAVGLLPNVVEIDSNVKTTELSYITNIVLFIIQNKNPFFICCLYIL
jgi:hypothetical protein